MKLPARMPLVYDELTKEQFNQEIQKGIDDIENGRTISSEELRAELKRNLGI